MGTIVIHTVNFRTRFKLHVPCTWHLNEKRLSKPLMQTLHFFSNNFHVCTMHMIARTHLKKKIILRDARHRVHILLEILLARVPLHNNKLTEKIFLIMISMELISRLHISHKAK